jgi:hypothetical protein
MKAIGAKQDPPNKTGFIYMLAGDTGANNADAHGGHEHWVQTGPHVMIVGPWSKTCRVIRARSMWLMPRSPTRCIPARHTNT